MTEEEAKSKVCCGPPSIAWATIGIALADQQKAELVGGYPKCQASDCMAWRWSEEKRTAAYLEAVVQRMKDTGETFNKATQEVVKRRADFAHTEGFCGLSGAPP